MPAVGLLTVKMRLNEAATSSTVTSRPSENLMPLRSVKVYVFPPSLTSGSASARSGTTVNDSWPSTFLKASRPSYIAWYSCQYCSV